jgi:dCMP deaminase
LRRAEAKAAARKTERRVDWHTYFMNIARQVASRSTCDRKHVGAVIVRDKTILSTGYNGSIRGMPHCDDVGHDLEGGHCVATIHAEANAILQAAKNGVMIEGAELYTTASPCWNCFKLIANAGITTIYYGEFYRDRKSLEVARRLGIDLIDLAPGGAGPAASAGTVRAAKGASGGRARGGCDWQGPED